MVRSFIIAAAVLSGSPVLAQEMVTTQQVVSYADLDLGKAAGQAKLRRRIAYAVDMVCGRLDIDLNSPEYRAVNNCRTAARKDANGRMALAIAAAESRPGIVVATADTH